MSLANGSTVAAVVGASRLTFGPHGVLAIRDGQADIEISGVWSSDDKPNVVGTIRSLDVNLMSGVLDLNADTHLALADGHVVGTPSGLTFNSLQSPVVIGSFAEVNVGLNDNSRFGVPNGFQVVTAAGARFVAKDAMAPFTIVEKKDSPIGKFDLHLPFRSFANAKALTFGLSNGDLSMVLTHEASGAMSGEHIEARGTLTMQMGTDLHSTNLALSGGSFALAAGSTRPTFSANLTTTIPPNVYIAFRTPGYNLAIK